MRRWVQVLGLLAALGIVSGQGAFAATTATFTWTLTIPESPLWATVRPDCVFLVEPGAETAECSTLVLMTQPTATTDGWQLQLWVSGLVDPRSGSTLPAGAVSVAGIEPMALREGQAIDVVGGPYVRGDNLFAPLNSPQTMVVAEPGFGNGAYQVQVRFALTVPAGTPAGRYIPDWAIGTCSSAI